MLPTIGTIGNNALDHTRHHVCPLLGCRVQRYDNFTAGNDDGYLRAHHLGTDHDQADITADGKPYWTENWTKKKGGGSWGLGGAVGAGGGLGQPNLSDHSSEPHSERLTTFYLGLFY